MRTRFALAMAGVFLLATAVIPTVDAATTCSFIDDGATLWLTADCTTDATILIPDGYTLDGQGHVITAVDPAAGHFLGAVISNAGDVAHVRDITVTASGLANVCDPSTPLDTRLRGVMLEGASGSITHTTVIGINQGPSGCQEGNGIEVRNAPFDGTHPGTVNVEIAHNTVLDYQKTGIVANGDVDVDVHHNTIGASATQANLAANSLQLGFGATGVVKHNQIDGNEWLGPSNFVATAVLVLDAHGSEISQNNIRGNSEVGMYLFANDLVVNNNKVFDEGPDLSPRGYDWGIGNWGAGNTVTNNKVRGFDVPYDGVSPCKGKGCNKVIPGPQGIQ